MNDLRNPSYRKAHGVHSPYGDQLKTKESYGLPIGTQRRFLDGEHAARTLGSPLNTLLTIRTAALPADAMGPAQSIH